MEDAVGLFWTRLLNWHVQNERIFPWRNTRDPYRVLVAEVLLQQTTAQLALTAYLSLTHKFPDVQALAQADQQKVVDTIKPIGLVHRAPRLQRCALTIIETFGGQVPNDRESLLRLPGIGPYIADAVLCYAFDQHAIPIDTNVLRVMSRCFGLSSNKRDPTTDKVLIENIAAHYPKPVTREENLAILDFAALVCKARNSKCPECPMSSFCAHHTQSDATRSLSEISQKAKSGQSH